MVELIGFVGIVVVVACITLIWYAVSQRGDSKSEQIKNYKVQLSQAELRVNLWMLTARGLHDSMQEIAGNQSGNPTLTAQLAIDQYRKDTNKMWNNYLGVK